LGQPLADQQPAGRPTEINQFPRDALHSRTTEREKTLAGL
jgi:hypothetical protein